MAAPECEREARKRRERRDSGCAHERKERRPHSEERAPPPPPTPPLHDYNRLESERRAERLSRARRPQFGGKRRRGPSRLPRQPKENDCFVPEPRDDTPCTTPPHFDYTVLQKPQLCEEPEPLDAGALHGAAAASAAAAERARRDERSVAPHSRRDPPAPDRRLDKITKKISVLKKSIAKHEAEFEAQYGTEMTASDRITDVQLTRMYETLRRLQSEKKCIKTDPVEYALKVQAAKQQKERDDKLDEALKSEKTMTEVVKDIEEWLEGCRNAAGRTTSTEGSWTSSQLAAEKSCVQRALLRLEAARGRPPAHSVERGAARHLYERYRAVKRALSGSRPDAVVGVNSELATILEHEAMLFNSVDSSSDSQGKPSDSSQETAETALQSPAAGSDGASSSSARSGPPAAANDLHCLGLDELARALHDAKLHKGVLRRNIKEYEMSFELQNSRKVQRDDKKGHEEEYVRYKAAKARIKLLNALINKQKSQNNS